jgi:hypothetical protein
MDSPRPFLSPPTFLTHLAKQVSLRPARSVDGRIGDRVAVFVDAKSGHAPRDTESALEPNLALRKDGLKEATLVMKTPSPVLRLPCRGSGSRSWAATSSPLRR